MHSPNFDFLDTVGYWSFRAALLFVFISWLVRHVIHELKTLKNAWLELRSGGGSQSARETQKMYPHPPSLRQIGQPHFRRLRSDRCCWAAGSPSARFGSRNDTAPHPAPVTVHRDFQLFSADSKPLPVLTRQFLPVAMLPLN